MTVRATVLGVLLALTAVAPAGAATVTWTEYVEPPDTPPQESCERFSRCPLPTVTVIDDRGERNDLFIEVSPQEVVVRDTTAPLEAGNGCTGQAGGGVVRCPAAGTFEVQAGAGDDVVRSGTATVEGGEGDDRLSGQTLIGGPGDDTLDGNEAGNRIEGGPGSDVIDGHGGDDTILDDDGDVLSADRLQGGPGIDSIGFAGRTQPVRVDLGDVQEAGSEGEGNTVAGFESATGGEGDDVLLSFTGSDEGGQVTRGVLEGRRGDDRLVVRSVQFSTFTASGSAGNDTIKGGASSELLQGGPGRDVITGAGGADEIYGGSGPDSLNGGRSDDGLYGGSGEDDLVGGAGTDALDGAGGDDALSAGAGNDTLVGGAGRDLLRGGSGRDRILARDGRNDDLDCGSSSDVADADARERAVGCETLRRPKKKSRR